MNGLVPVCALIFLAAFSFCLSLAAPAVEKAALEERLERLLTRPKTASPRLERRCRVSDIAFLDFFLSKFEFLFRLKRWLEQAEVPLSPAGFGALCGIAGLTAFLAVAELGAALFWATGIAFVCGLVPVGIALMRRNAKMRRFGEGFPDAVGRMASSLRAGYSLSMALESVAEDRTTAVAREFRKVLAEMEVGQPFETAIENVLDRVDTPDLRLFISSVKIQRESGGNLAELLDNLEGTIRERFALQRELDAATSQAKFSGLVLCLLPVFVAFFVFLIHRDYVLFFFDDPAGKNLFKLCVAGQALGLWSVRKIVRIEM